VSERQYRWLLVLAIVVTFVAMLVIVLSPSGSTGAGGEWGRGLSREQSWVIHAVMFGGWGLLISLWMATDDEGGLGLARLALAAIVLAIVGALFEAAQTHVESRSASTGDWVSDMLGGALGLAGGAIAGQPVMSMVTRRASSTPPQPPS